MKAFLILLMFLVIPLTAQNAQYWGKNGPDIEWNKSTKFNADSTGFFGSTPTFLDTVGTDSIFYTDLIMTKGDAYEGVFHMTFSVDSILGMAKGIDSLDLYMRRYLDSALHLSDYWDSWKAIVTSAKAGTVYEYQIADSTWWRPSDGFQLKLVARDALLDTLDLPNIGLYIR